MPLTQVIRYRAALLIALVLVILLTGCRRKKTPPAPEEEPAASWFADITTAAGLDFCHDSGPVDGSYFLPQIMGSGAALFDMDNDGRLDIYLIQNGGSKGNRNQLYRQRSDGTFVDVSAGSGLNVAGDGMGVAVGDVNNDGLPDVYLTGHGEGQLFLNLGECRFSNATKQAGIEDRLWGTSVSFVDYDRDGWLDLVVVHYLKVSKYHPCLNPLGQSDYCHPSNFPGTVAHLYRNRGIDPAGKWLGFEDRTIASGLAKVPGPGLGILCADFNSDGWPDMFVANDAQPNRLWINQKDGTFNDEAISRGVAYNGLGQTQGNMGVAFGDVNGDGMPDLFVTHLINEHHTLWKQGPSGQFRDASSQAGLTSVRWRGTGFGTTLADFNHDGALDLASVNGGVFRTGPADDRSHWGPYSQRNQLFSNDGKGRFGDISIGNPEFCDWRGVSRGLAVGDIDGDGAPDLLVTQVAGPARLYRNVSADRGHWLMVRALDCSGRRDAIGAEVQIEAGQRRWWRLIQPGSSYLCSNDPRAHFGLGAATEITSIRVVWPDGSREAFPGGGVDRIVPVRQGQGTPITSNKKAKQ